MRHAAFVLVALVGGCSIKHRSDDIIDAPPTTGDPDAMVVPDGRSPDAPDPFDVREVPGLMIWLDANQGITKDNSNRVGRWADQSPNANDAAPTSDTSRPEFVTGSMNGQPAIRFGTNRQPQLAIKDSPTMDWDTSDFLLVIVTKFKNDPESQSDGLATLWSKGGNGPGVGLFGNREGNVTAEPGAGATGRVGGIGISRIVRATNPINDNQPHMIALRRIDDALEIRIDGVASATTTQVNNINVNNSSAVLIGSLFNGTAVRLDGDIAEIIGVVGEGAKTHLDQVEGYLSARYGL